MKCCFEIISLTLVFGLILVVNLPGQTEKIEVLRPGRVTTYSVDDGLLGYRTDKVFEDNVGRLWLNPGGEQRIYKKLNFYQYDGRDAIIPQLDVEESEFNGQLQIITITPNNEIIGRVATDNYFFRYLPDENEFSLIELQEGNIPISALSTEDGNIYFCYANQNYIHFGILDEEGLVPVAVMENQFAKIALERFPNFYTLNNYFIISLYNLERDSEDGEYALSGFARFDPTKNELHRISWPNLFSKTDLAQTDRIEFSLFPLNNDQLMIMLKEEKGWATYILDKDFQALKPNFDIASLIPKDAKRLAYHKTFLDNSGNTIIRKLFDLSDGSRKYIEVLLNKEDNILDYSLVLGAAVNASKYKDNRPTIGFFGNNFQERVMVSLAGGIVLVDIQNSFYNTVTLEERALRAIVEYEPGKLFVANDLNNWDIINLENGDRQILDFDDLCIKSTTLLPFSNIISLENGEIQFAAGEQLIQYNLHQRTCITYDIGIPFSKFTYIDQTRIILGSHDHQLYVYDLSNQQLDLFIANGVHLNLQDEINQLHLDKDSLLWVATYDGLYRIDLKSRRLKYFNTENGLSDKRITSIYEDEKDRLWLGTFNGGLNIFDKLSEKVKVVDEELPNKRITGILGDEENYFWVATFNGLSILDSTGNLKLNLFKEDGLSDSEFNFNSYSKLQGDKLAFGGINGLNILDAKVIRDDIKKLSPIKIHLKQLSYFDKSTEEEVYEYYHSNEEPLSIPASHRYLKIDFSSTCYAKKGGSYFYQIGSNSEWIPLRDNKNITLTNLPFGKYDISIKGTSLRGRQTIEPLKISLHVKRFFYQSFGFYLIILLLVSLLVYSKVYTDKKAKFRLKEEVIQATQKINESKLWIEKQAEQLKSIDKLKTHFYANIAHEFKTPLSVIRSISDKIKANPEQWAIEGGQLIDRNLQSLFEMVSRVLELSQIDPTKLEANIVYADVNKFIVSVINNFKALVDIKSIRMHFLTSDKVIEIDYDSERLRFILSNLISNAIKFTPQNGDIYIETIQDDNFFKLQIQDTGVGIPKDQLNQIFEKDFQIDHNQLGTGIGLALVKETVEILGGKINVQSERGTGTIFVICLPAKLLIRDKAIESQTDYNAPVPVINEVIGVKEVNNTSGINKIIAEADLQTLLLIDDNSAFTSYFSKVFKEKYQVITSNDANEGISIATEHLPDIIICDLLMPMKDGYTTCEELKKNRTTSHIPIIMLTVKDGQDIKVTALEKGVDAFLSKPFDEIELEATINNLLAQRRNLQELYASQSGILKKRSPGEKFLDKINKVVHQNLSDANFGIQNICSEIGMSRSQLYKRIKAITGLSTAIYIRSIRLKKAEELLRDSDLNISEIAFELGFKEPKYFSKVFTETYGISPSTFREERNN